jgi:predicted metal-dependent hydrolase
VPLQEIQEIITKRSSWIGRQIQLQAERPVIAPKKFIDGEEFLYLGRAYVLRLVERPSPGVILRAGEMILAVPSAIGESRHADAVRDILVDWYQRRAEDILAKTSALLAEKLGISPTKITVREYRSQWGSCSVTGHIRYSWRIILAPWEVVEYVTAHELAHLRNHDHSSRFWRCVEILNPQYRGHRDWLRTHGATLHI